MTNSLAALVPVKGNSERVPNKNKRTFNDSPLFHLILNTLEATSSIGEILVNTDDPEIADGAAANFPVKIIERSDSYEETTFR